MAEEQQQVTEAVAQTESAPPASTTTESTPSSAGLTSGTTTPEAFTPDWAYEFNGEKREVDEFFRPLAKDKDALAKVKDYIQRAEALPFHKEMTGKLKTQIGEWEPIVDQVSQLKEKFADGDHETVLDALGYDDETLFKIVKAKLDRQQNPELAKKYESERAASLEKNQFMQQTEFYRTQAEQALAKTTSYELDSELGRADYQGVKEAYDKAYGNGAFKNLVIERGAIAVERAGRHISPSELIPMVAKEFAPFLSNARPAQGTESVATMQQEPIKPKTIPQVGRSTSSPTKQSVRSLDDLRKLRDAANR